MNNYVNAYDKHVGSVLVYKGFDEDAENWDGFYYKDKACTEKLTADEAIEIFLHNNLIVAEEGEGGTKIYMKAISLKSSLEDEDDESTREFEIIINNGERSAVVPEPESEDVGKVLKVYDKDGEYVARWMDNT